MAVAVFPRTSSSEQIATPPPALKKALVVDDSATILHAVCSLLEHHQIVNVVGRSESGLDAVDSVRLLKPDLLLLDADMPGMSGLRTSLVVSQLHPEVRIILMSMETGHRFVQACHDCGADAVIYKPRFLKELTEVLQAHAPHIMQPIRNLKEAPRGFNSPGHPVITL
jgi:DNA-binding NarL/FixJ family response regulator